jgi:hypothetical protein
MAPRILNFDADDGSASRSDLFRGKGSLDTVGRGLGGTHMHSADAKQGHRTPLSVQQRGLKTGRPGYRGSIPGKGRDIPQSPDGLVSTQSPIQWEKQPSQALSSGG